MKLLHNVHKYVCVKEIFKDHITHIMSNFISIFNSFKTTVFVCCLTFKL